MLIFFKSQFVVVAGNDLLPCITIKNGSAFQSWNAITTLYSTVSQFYLQRQAGLLVY